MPDAQRAPWQIVHLPTNSDVRGSITICESGVQLPFTIKRARWVYDAPSGAKRGGHAHHRTTQLFVAVAGALTVAVDDTTQKERVRLDKNVEVEERTVSEDVRREEIDIDDSTTRDR